MSESQLFSPLTIRGVTSRNRVMVSPMCMYAATDGLASDYHLVHLGRFALGGAGIVVAEATAVQPGGRISSSDLGLWNDEQAEALIPVVTFLKERGSVPGIQLAHAGRKACNQVPWEGGMPLPAAGSEHDEESWQVVAPSAVAAGPGWQTPLAMSREDIAATVRAWRDAAERATAAGFEVIDVHGAHGYLLHSFLSPISNHRSDEYGGSFENRMRFPLEVVEAIREVFPEDRALFYRLNVVDGVEGGLTIEDTEAFAVELGARGVDVIDCSSGGIVTDRRCDTRVPRGFAFHAPFSSALKATTGLLVATVGLVVDPRQAEAIVRHGDADIVALGREMLADPHWAHHAQAALDGIGFDRWHNEAGFWLEKRVAALRDLAESGETPMSRYSSAGAGTDMTQHKTKLELR